MKYSRFAVWDCWGCRGLVMGCKDAEPRFVTGGMLFDVRNGEEWRGKLYNNWDLLVLIDREEQQP